MLYLIPLVCFTLTLFGGMYAARTGRRWLVLIIAAVLIAAMVWAIWQARQLPGWDGMGYSIFAALMAAPGILGVLIGGIIGWVRRARSQARSSAR